MSIIRNNRTLHFLTWGSFLCLLLLCAACGNASVNTPPTPAPARHSVTPTPVHPIVTPTSTPRPIQPEGTILYYYTGHSSLITAIAWSPDGTMIASGSDDESVQVWNATTGQHIATYHGHSGDIQSVAWSPDGRYIASSQQRGYDVEVKLYSAIKVITPRSLPWPGHLTVS